jgi:glutathione synthase/RimK-type ligase-like ATP-grasp enzyme
MPRATKIALATCARVAELADDDRPLLGALARLGAAAEPVVWDDPSVDWSAFDRVVIRSCWDYHLRVDEFLRWATCVGPALRNGAEVVRWNADKRYLRDLGERGVRIPKTVFVERGAEVDGEAVWAELGRDAAVVKPTVSATAHRTYLVRSADGAGARLPEILRESGALVQEFVPEVCSAGEWSLVFLGGRFSHAVVKRPRRGDFRVQSEFGGEDRLVDPPPRLVEEAAGVLARAEAEALYARVDCVERDGELCLMELELIEPSLFLARAPGAAERFAAAILAGTC